MISLSTRALDCFSKTFQLSDGSIVNCFIYDTCGQERYNSLNTSYYSKADAVLLVYDISNQKSFDLIKTMYSKTIKQYCKKKIPIILLGNKTDLPDRQVKIEDGIELAINEKYGFVETSCVTNDNVAGAFESLIEMWNIENRRNNDENSTLVLGKDENKVKESKCKC